MNALVVYYSFEGTVKMLAELIAKELNASLLELKLVYEPKSKDYMKYYLGEKQVLMRTQPKLQPYSLRLDDYELIIIGTPVWSGTFAPAIRTFIAQEKIAGKKIAFFYSFAVKKGLIGKHLRKALPGNEILSEIGFKEPLQGELTIVRSRIKAWAQKLRENLSTKENSKHT